MHQIGDLIATLLVHRNVHRVGVAEEIVEVAQYLLVRASQEDSQHVLLAFLHRMQLQRRLALAAAGETVDDAVRVAGDVLQRSPPVGPLIQPVHRHDGKELVDGPVVGK